MLKIVLGVVLLLVGVLVAANAIGARLWRAETTSLRERLQSHGATGATARVDLSSLDALPEPVQRYLRLALRDGQPYLAGVSLRHRGSFNMSENAEQWKAFTSDQEVVISPPGFDWNARIGFLPGLGVRVHDAYVQGEGILHASVLGLFTVADLRGTPAIAKGELMRFLAESVWYPTVLLPGQGVEWLAVDGQSADATLTTDGISVTLRFGFGADGLVETVFAEGRGRAIAGTVVPTPWEGRFWDYAEREGMMVPLQGEVAWLLPNGNKPYWRGTITDLVFRFGA